MILLIVYGLINGVFFKIFLIINLNKYIPSKKAINPSTRAIYNRLSWIKYNSIITSNIKKPNNWISLKDNLILF
jgi:hypothetical protein